MSAFWKEFIRGGLIQGFGLGEGIGLGIRSEEGRSGEAASCSYHIIIWYLEGLLRGNYVLAKIG